MQRLTLLEDVSAVLVHTEKQQNSESSGETDFLSFCELVEYCTCRGRADQHRFFFTILRSEDMSIQYFIEAFFF
jgi:hypothetical protein